MMLTEEQAQTKWCPQAKNGGRCIASKCMAWRWHEGADFKLRAEAEFRKTGRRLETNEGYCGFAGKP